MTGYESEHHFGKNLVESLSTRNTNGTKNLVSFLKKKLFRVLTQPNEICKTETAKHSVIAGLTRNRMPERERAEAEGLIRRREGGGVGKPKCRYMRVSKTAHHPDTKMQGGTSNGRGKRKIAFTLAEVLITLGIIGIVAAMTMPALIQNHHEKAMVAKVKKTYSILQQAYMMAVQESGTPDEWGMGGMYEEASHITLANKMKPYMKITTDCVGMTAEQVLERCTKRFASPRDCTSVRIADGTAVIFRVWDGQCNGNYGNNKYLQNVCGEIFINTEPQSSSLAQGKNIFNFYITKNGIYPMGTDLDQILTMEEFCNASRVFGQRYGSFTNGAACTAWVLYNENMDYLHCELNWNSGKKNCKK